MSAKGKRCPSGSNRSRSKKEGKGKKKEGPDHAAIIQDLNSLIDKQKLEIEALKEDVGVMKQKKETAEDKVSEVFLDLIGLSEQYCTKKDKLKVIALKDRFPILSDITKPNLTELMTLVIGKKKHMEDSVATRCEELETRVTQMSHQVAGLVESVRAYELGLDDLLNTYDVATIHAKAQGLKYERVRLVGELKVPAPDSDNDDSGMEGDQLGQSSPRSINTTAGLSLPRPFKRLAGNTPIREMDRDLRTFVTRELSLERPARNDWRTIAERVGISQEDIRDLEMQRIGNPMERVLATWQRSVGATVRLLHRHVMSPQMRSHLIAKRVSDMYNID